MDNAKEELKRVDHLIYVSLKYTRTVDVIRSVIERLINALEFIINGLLEKAVEDKKIEKIPVSGGSRSNLVKEIYKEDKKIVDAIDFQISLKKIMRAKYTREKEFRRPVRMISDVEGKEVITNIDEVYEYFEKMKSFLEYIEGKYI